MKTEWDYTDLAEAYLKRPEYAEEAIEKMIRTAHLKTDAKICDVGAGAAHLTLMMARRGFEICAVEPNDAMRKNGINRTKQFEKVSWFEGVGEHTGMESNAFDLVTFGSSFNVCNRQEALAESARILQSKGWFACMWNHRDLEDSLQKEIEAVIVRNVPEYSYGTRREDQSAVIAESNLFEEAVFLEGSVTFDIPAEDFIEGWKSHGTVQRQSKELFHKINSEIRELVLEKKQPVVKVPYTTRIWMAQKKE